MARIPRIVCSMNSSLLFPGNSSFSLRITTLHYITFHNRPTTALRAYPVSLFLKYPKRKKKRMRAQDEQSRVLCELSSMIVHILKSPPLSSIPFPLPFPNSHATTSSSAAATSQASPSPTAFASLFLGISLALMLFGSVTFAIGFILMPLVTGLVLLFYAVEILFNLSQFGRSILCPNSSPPDFPAFREYDHTHGY